MKKHIDHHNNAVYLLIKIIYLFLYGNQVIIW